MLHEKMLAFFSSLHGHMNIHCSKNHPPKVRGFMLDVMCPLISENDSVSPDLLEVILKNLIDSKKVENAFANILARDLVKRTATSIEPAMQSVSKTCHVECHCVRPAKQDVGYVCLPYRV